MGPSVEVPGSSRLILVGGVVSAVSFRSRTFLESCRGVVAGLFELVPDWWGGSLCAGSFWSSMVGYREEEKFFARIWLKVLHNPEVE